MNEEKARVALFIRGFHNGGIEKVFESYFRHLDMSHFEIHVITHMKNLEEKVLLFESMGCVIHRMHRVHGHKITLTNLREYRKLFAEHHFNVVHNNMPENLLPLIFARLYGVPQRILHAHNVYIPGLGQKRGIRAAAYRAGFSLNAALATVLLAVSKEAANSAFGPKFGKRAELLVDAIEVQQFSFNAAKRDEMRHLLGIDDSYCLGHIGRYENDQKNQEFVLQVFASVRKILPQAKLLLIGDGPRRSTYQNMVKETNLDDGVIFTGAVSNVADYLQAMDVFLLPSRREGLGIAAVEAQASGLPCIVSDAVPHEVKVTENIKFLPIDTGVDPWVECINDLIDFARCDASGQVAAAGYDVSSVAGCLEGLYRAGC